jgi:hypothetical protein
MPIDKTSQDVIISKAFGDLLFPDGKALGKRLEDSDGDQYRVVGVIDRFYNPYGWPIHEYVMFFPNSARSYQGGAPYLVRAEPGRKAAVLASIEKALLTADGGRNLQVQPVSQIKERFQSRSAILVTILSVVIALLLFITSLGIVGLTVFSVAERTRQIGTRRALGAQRGDILRYFLPRTDCHDPGARPESRWPRPERGPGPRVSGPKMELGPSRRAFSCLIAGLAATFLPALRGPASPQPLPRGTYRGTCASPAVSGTDACPAVARRLADLARTAFSRQGGSAHVPRPDRRGPAGHRGGVVRPLRGP